MKLKIPIDIRRTCYTMSAVEEELEITVARQCAQQWFSVLVGTDGYAHPWQDEAVCEFAMLSCMEALHGSDYKQHLIRNRVEASQQENILSSVTPGSPIDYFSSLNDYAAVVYEMREALGTGGTVLQRL